MNGRPKHNQIRQNPDIAVIGMAGRFPGAGNIDEFWQNLRAGRETISFFSKKELEKDGLSRVVLDHPDYVRAKGVLKDIDLFDAGFFGYPPREAQKMDPQIRILHECAWEALENGGVNPDAVDGSIGAYFGANANLEWMRRVLELEASSPENQDGFLLNHRDYVATRISYKLNLEGPSFTVLSACSTSLVTIHLACQAIIRGECKMALAGGVSLSLPRKSGYFYQEGLMVSRSGHCRTFDAGADGTVFGDGVGVVVLKPLKTALDEGDHIYAVIKGSAVNNDGQSKVGFTAPSISGQTAVIKAAHQAAGVSPQSISYIEVHGTATRLGDPIEFKALQQVFHSAGRQTCRIGSVKTNIGHVNIAAGVSSFIKTVLSLKNLTLPPSLHFRSPNPEIDFQNSPFLVNTESVPWETPLLPRRAGVSAFGFGGTNAHIVLEEAPEPAASGPSRKHQILLLSGKTRSAMNKASARITAHLKNDSLHPLADIAFTLCLGRKHFEYRKFSVCGEIEEAFESLSAPSHSSRIFSGQRTLVFQFPGQGSQYALMGADLYRMEPEFKRHLDECAEILKSESSIDIRESLFPAPDRIRAAEAELEQTLLAQPAIFSISYALARLWMKWGIRPDALVGHSIGEYVAACLAGVMTLQEALHLVAERGRLMQELPLGDMLAVPLSETEIQPLLSDRISLAAVNAPRLCVVSGGRKAVASLKARLTEEGIECRNLHTSHAFHSPMMEPILAPFSETVRQVNLCSARIPIFSSVTGKKASAEAMADSQYWIRNLRRPVRFADAVKALNPGPGMILLEVGPGRTLSSLAALCTPPVRRPLILNSLRGNKEAVNDQKYILEVLGRLWQTGIEPYWKEIFAGEKRNRVPIPTYPFERQRYWIDRKTHDENAIRRLDSLEKIQDLDKWCSVPSWKRSDLPPIHKSGRKRKMVWLFLMDDLGVASGLEAQLNPDGKSIVKVYHGPDFRRIDPLRYQINPSRKQDFTRLFRTLEREKLLPSRLVHFWLLTQRRNRDPFPEEVRKSQVLGFSCLLYTAQIMGASQLSSEIDMTVVTNDLHDVNGEEKIQFENSPVLGPVKVIPQEYPNVECRNLDFSVNASKPAELNLMIKQISQELCRGTTERIVAYRGNYRWIQIYEPYRLSPLKRSSLLRKQGVYLISGGLGGIGLVFAEFLGKKYQAGLILTGRSRFPRKTDWEEWLITHKRNDSISRKIRTLQRIEKAGGRVVLLQGDISDSTGMKKKINRAQAVLGPVNGVIHAAGVPGEGILQLKTNRTAQGILSPKIQGTLVLEDIFKNAGLDFFILCSSIASVLGGIGLGDYCAANSFLDAFACHHNRQKKGIFLSINWDMWGQVGMGLKTEMPQELKEWFEKELKSGITSTEGLKIFQRLLSGGQGGNIVVSTRDLQVRLDLWIRGKMIKEKQKFLEQENAQPKFARPNLSSEYVPPQTPAEKKIAEIWARLFGIDRVGGLDNFYELGGHSLLATTLLNMLRKEFKTTISIRDVLDNPTVSDLARMIKEVS